MKLLDILKRDLIANNYNPKLVELLIRFFTNYGFKAVVYYRISNYFALKNYNKFANYLKNRSLRITGCEISCFAEIGPGLTIPHPNGIVIAKCTIGEQATIYQNVTIGMNNGKVPSIGSRCFMGAGAKILGEVIIGNDVKIGANAVVLKSIESNSTVVGIPGKIVNKVEE